MWLHAILGLGSWFKAWHISWLQEAITLIMGDTLDPFRWIRFGGIILYCRSLLGHQILSQYFHCFAFTSAQHWISTLTFLLSVVKKCQHCSDKTDSIKSFAHIFWGIFTITFWTNSNTQYMHFPTIFTTFPYDTNCQFLGGCYNISCLFNWSFLYRSSRIGPISGHRICSKMCLKKL